MKVKRLFGLVFHGCGVYNDQGLFNIAQHRKIITSYAAEEAMSCYDSPLVAGCCLQREAATDPLRPFVKGGYRPKAVISSAFESRLIHF